jgi:hypothetical protein
MNKNEAQAQIEYIRSLMDRSARYTNLSPLAALGLGVLGLAAAGYSQWLLNGTLLYQPLLNQLVISWSLCLIAAVGIALLFSVRRAKKMGEAIWIEPIKRGLTHFLMIALFGGILTAVLCNYLLFFLIPAVWMLCYGTGLYVVSSYSIKELRTLGLAFFALGTIAAFLPLINFIMLMLTFGAGHCVLALVIYRKYSEQNIKPQGGTAL